MRVSKNIYKKEDMTWQIIRDFLLDVTDSNGIVDKGVVQTAKRHKLYRWAKVSLIIKRGDKIFNGQSDVHINIMAKNYFEKYINFKYPPHRAYNEIGQTTLPFKDKPKIGCKLTPYIDKNAPDYEHDYPIEMEICQPGQKPVKHKVQRTWTPIVETPKQQIGLIRKLWRWIY
jgi:hypothetical protein